MSFIVESNSLERHQFKKMFNKKNIIKFLIVLFLGMLITGYLYEQGEARIYIGETQGKSILINQVNYNYELYGQGDYTVIINGSSGESLLHREALKEEFKGNARLFFYERPGYPSSEGEFKSPQDIAKDLHFMFRRFGFEMKFIFVGEEYGSLVMQEYINLYPDEVIGGIFINPLGKSQGSPNLKRYVDRETASFPSKKVLGYVGIPRFLQNTGLMDFYNRMSFRTEKEKQRYTNLMLSKKMMGVIEKELNYLNLETPMEIKDSVLGDRPMVLMTNEKNRTEFDQDDYMLYSKDSELSIYADSIKDVMFQQPQDIASNLNALIKKITRMSYR